MYRQCRRTSKKAAFIAESKNNRSRCYELSEQITNEVAADSGKFQLYLDVQARFDRYTANNALLILAQRPDAERLEIMGTGENREYLSSVQNGRIRF